MKRIAGVRILLMLCTSLLIAGCASQGKMTKRDEVKQAIAKAKQEATLTCTSKAQCDKAFMLAKLFVAQKASMDIRHSGEDMVLTYEPKDGGMTGMAAQLIPDVGEVATINLIAVCKHMDMMTVPGTYPYFDQCAERLMSAYTGFKPFIESRLR